MGASPATVASRSPPARPRTPSSWPGLARELRVVQDARKAAALEVGDRIELALALDGDLAGALSAHRDRVAAETLAAEIVSRRLTDPAFEQDFDVDSEAVVVGLRRT